MNADLIKNRMKEIEHNPKLYIERSNQQVIPPSSYEEALSLLLLGRAYLLVGVHKEAINPLNQAILFLEKHGFRHALFQAHINLGTVYREDKEYYLSMGSFEKAIDISYELDHFSYIISALVGLASVYIELENLDKAFQYFKKALSYASQVEGEQILGDLYNNYAYALMLAKRYEDALKMFEKCKLLYDHWFPERNHINLIIVTMNIGELFFRLEKFSLSKERYEEALFYAKREGIDFLSLEASEYLFKIAEIQGEYELALKHHKAYLNYKSLLESQEENEQLEVIKSNLEETTQKNQDEIHLLRNIALKNKTDVLEKTLLNLGVIAEVGQKLIASMDIDAIFSILKTTLPQIIQADVFGLVLFDSKSGDIDYKYFEENGKKIPPMKLSLKEGVGLAAYAIKNGADVFVKNIDVEYPLYTEQIPRFPHSNFQSSKSLIYCRLISEGECLGLISIQSYTANAYTDEDNEIFKALAAYVAIAIANANKKSIIQKKAEELEYLSYYDPLTNLPNRRAFNRMIMDSKEASYFPAGIIVGDMNNLKRVNDRFGHMAGDQYLVDASDVIQKCASPYLAYRLGGDEFAVFLNHSDEKTHQEIITCILEKFEEKSVFEEPFSISLGYAYQKDSDEPIAKVYSRAETRMYAHKHKFHLGRR